MMAAPLQPLVGVAPAPPVPGAPPTAPILTLIDCYRDQRFDLDNDDYCCLLVKFDPTAQIARTAVELQTAILAKGDALARALIAHWQDPYNAIVVVHDFKLYPYSLLSGPTPLDNQDFLFYFIVSPKGFRKSYLLRY
jgi:hypothetical protein